jgi:hypothetical protein
MRYGKSDLLSVESAGYDNPAFVRAYLPYAPHQRPIFTARAIEQMLQDPRICFGLELLKGPIHSFTKFFSQEEATNPKVHKMVVESNVRFPYLVQGDDERVVDFVTRNLKRFWQVGAIKALSALDWGYSGSEVIYTQKENGEIHFDNLKNFDGRDIQVITQGGGVVGFEVNYHRANTLYLGIPKGFWHVHARENNRFYGQSRLYGAYAAWWEIWTEGGARDIRRNWFYRNAFGGGIMRYPMGSVKTEDGAIIQNRDLALEMMAKFRSGGYLVFPNQDQNGRQAWEYEPPVAGIMPPGLLEYARILADEELEGLGIPPEVVQGGDGGLGSSSGRSIPMIAFYSTLQKIVDFLIGDFTVQILNPLIRLNFRKNVEYDVMPFLPVEGYEEGSNVSAQEGGRVVPQTEQVADNVSPGTSE